MDDLVSGLPRSKSTGGPGSSLSCTAPGCASIVAESEGSVPRRVVRESKNVGSCRPGAGYLFGPLLFVCLVFFVPLGSIQRHQSCE